MRRRADGDDSACASQFVREQIGSATSNVVDQQRNRPPILPFTARVLIFLAFDQVRVARTTLDVAESDQRALHQEPPDVLGMAKASGIIWEIQNQSRRFPQRLECAIEFVPDFFPAVE